MVGMERAAFCSTGSEAVMAAIRVARMVSGRDTIVAFAGSYHGVSDEVLVRPTMSGDGRTARRTRYSAAMADNILVLEYGTPEALETIRSPGLAAAVPSNWCRAGARTAAARIPARVARGDRAERHRPDLRRDGDRFRAHPGGAQSVFGVRADIATYGR